MEPSAPTSHNPTSDGNTSLNATLLNYLSQPDANPHFVGVQVEENHEENGPHLENLSSSPPLDTFWLGSASQYTLSYFWNHWRCCPRMRIRPNYIVGGEGGAGEIEIRSASKGCWLPCFLRAGSGQRISIGVRDHNNDDQFVEKLSFNYSPNIWLCGRNIGYDESINFFSPDRPEPIGWIQLGSDVTNGSKIGLYSSQDTRFNMTQNASEQMGVTFSNISGRNVAAAAVTRWIKYRVNFIPVKTTWTEFTLAFATPVTVLSDSERTLLFAVFVLWVLNAQEGFHRRRCQNLIIMLIIGVLFFGIVMWTSNSK